jgi:hypothetical protein
MIGVIEYYQPPPREYRSDFKPGQICYAPIPFVLDCKPRRLRIDYHNPENPSNTSYVLEQTDLQSYNPNNDPSLRFLGLLSDEFLLSVGYKKRPVVLISDPLTDPENTTANYSGYLVAPCYSLCNSVGDYKPKITRKIILQSQAYQISNIFYLPKSEEYSMQEAFVRLDRIQFVRMEQLSPIPTILTPKAIELLRQWAWKYLGMPALLDPALEEYIKTAATKITD